MKIGLVRAHGARRVLALSAVGLAAPAMAIVPEWQHTSLKEVVRLNDNCTATVVEKFRAEDGKFYICLLTADHCMQGTRKATNFIKFGDRTAPDALPYGVEFAYRGVFKGFPDEDEEEKFENPDLAVLGVEVDAMTWGMLTPRTICPIDPLTADTMAFTTMGYGRSGGLTDRFPFPPPAPGGNGIIDGYNPALPIPYGELRFANNTGDVIDNATFDKWTFDAWRWDLDAPVGGEGTITPGDSGGPLFKSAPVVETFYNEHTQAYEDVTYYTDYIIGVNSFGDGNYFFGEAATGIGGFHFDNAVMITPEYDMWIRDRCADIRRLSPAPGAGMVFAAAALAFAARRRRV